MLQKKIGPLPVWAIAGVLGGAVIFAVVRGRGGASSGGIGNMVAQLAGGKAGRGPGNEKQPGPEPAPGSEPGGGPGVFPSPTPAPIFGSPSSGTGASSSSTTSAASAPQDEHQGLISSRFGWVTPALLQQLVAAESAARATVTANATKTDAAPTTSVARLTYTPPPNIAYQEARTPATDPTAGLVSSKYGWVTPAMLAQLYAAEQAAKAGSTPRERGAGSGVVVPAPTATKNGQPIDAGLPMSTAKTPSGAFQYPTPAAESGAGATTPREGGAGSGVVVEPDQPNPLGAGLNAITR